MTQSTLEQSLCPALAAWQNLVSDGPDKAGVDFTETNRTHLCRDRFDSFLESPTPETFRALWSAETL